jgi:hypothetical protein
VVIREKNQFIGIAFRANNSNTQEAYAINTQGGNFGSVSTTGSTSVQNANKLLNLCRRFGIPLTKNQASDTQYIRSKEFALLSREKILKCFYNIFLIQNNLPPNYALQYAPT